MSAGPNVIVVADELSVFDYFERLALKELTSDREIDSWVYFIKSHYSQKFKLNLYPEIALCIYSGNYHGRNFRQHLRANIKGKKQQIYISIYNRSLNINLYYNFSRCSTLAHNTKEKSQEKPITRFFH